MSTVFPTGASLPARVGPKVFADVPSARELEEAKRNAEKTRRSRNAVTLWLILAIGALVAAIAFIAILLLMPKPLPPAPAPGDDPAVLKAQIAELNASLATTRENLKVSQDQIASFAGLPEAEAGFKTAVAAITPYLLDTTTYGNIRARTLRDRPNPTRAQWAVYDAGVAREGRAAWKGEDAAQVKANIDASIRDLAALLVQIKATGPLVPVPKPPCVEVGPGSNC